MSGGGWKEPFYKVAKQDSRNLADLFNKIGFQKGEDAANYNVKNPGHAVSTAAEYALAGYLGSLFGAGSAAGEAAAPVIDESAGLAMNATGTAAANVAEQALQQGGLLAQNGVTELSANAVPVKDLSTQAGLLDKARLAFSSGSNTGKGGLLAQQLGMQMMKPQQQPMPQAMPQRQGNMDPLPKTYNQGPYGTPAGNSTGGMSEEMKRRLRALGYPV